MPVGLAKNPFKCVLLFILQWTHEETGDQRDKKGAQDSTAREEQVQTQAVRCGVWVYTSGQELIHI